MLLENNMKVNVYSENGKKKEAVTMPGDLMAEKNIAILTQAIRVFENRQHPGLARTKTRSEITSSKHKIYKQKGTGGARHGARSAPIFVGGGIAHGRTSEKRTLVMPSKMRKRALEIALGLKAQEGRLLIVEGFSKLEKTKDAQNLVNAIVKEEKLTNTRFTIALSGKSLHSRRSLRNLKDVSILPYKNLNAYSVFFGGTILLDAEALDENKESGKPTVKKDVVAKKVVVKKTVKTKKSK
jgi:large subunit ribosomal protein L4